MCPKPVFDVIRVITLEAATCQKMDRSYAYTAFSQKSYSIAETIINLYEKSTKYKISQICDAAVSENRQRDRKQSLYLVSLV